MKTGWFVAKPKQLAESAIYSEISATKFVVIKPEGEQKGAEKFKSCLVRYMRTA